MVGFIQLLYDTDGYYSYAQLAMSGLKYIRQRLKNSLPRSERALKSWKLSEPPMQHALLATGFQGPLTPRQGVLEALTDVLETRHG